MMKKKTEKTLKLEVFKIARLTNPYAIKGGNDQTITLSSRKCKEELANGDN
ncbi:hypothetical protein [Sinomicrobium pectinilyticum]|uniref:hypothetical protein n=1 Tax=Sinomicrobium pectinilyticum TaxID=1084421 RepID=UPI001475035D|nr:hypothetical protein [Sinomicrobium pectinilyticum]